MELNLNVYSMPLFLIEEGEIILVENYMQSREERGKLCVVGIRIPVNNVVQQHI